MNKGFQVQVTYKDDDLVEALVSAWNGSFGGEAELFLEVGELARIADQIVGFPCNTSDAREMALGTFDRNFAGGGVKLHFHCIGGAGRAFLEVKIESGYESAGTLQSAILSIPIEAAAVDTFISELRRLDSAGRGKAYIGSDRRSAMTDS